MIVNTYAWLLWLDASTHRHPRLYPRRFRNWVCRHVEHGEWLG